MLSGIKDKLPSKSKMNKCCVLSFCSIFVLVRLVANFSFHFVKKTVFLNLGKSKTQNINRSSPAEELSSYLKKCSKFTGEYPCRSVISVKLLCNFIEITLRHGCSPVDLLHTFRTTFSKKTSGGLLLYKISWLFRHRPYQYLTKSLTS